MSALFDFFRTHGLLRAFVSVALLWGMACVQPAMAAGQQNAAAVATTGQQGAVTAGDVIAIQVYKHPDLSVNTTVSANGFINYPLIGRVKVAGLTPEQVAGRIAGGLRTEGYMTSPQVTVYIRESVAEQVSVLGAVGRPGRYSITRNSNRLFDVLAMAGGLSGSAGYDVVVIRPKASGAARRQVIDVDQALNNGNMALNPALNPGDVVYVPKASVVYIYGHVARSGAYPLTLHMTVRQLISRAGGLTTNASTGGIKIIERRNGKTVARQAQLSSQLSANMVVHVPQSLF